MGIFFKDRMIESQLNGRMIFRQYVWGEWFIATPGGIYQSGTKIEKMWKSFLIYFFKKFHAHTSNPQSILVLGGGAASVINEIRKLWNPKILDIVEYDESLAMIGKELFGKNVTSSEITWSITDASHFIETCHTTYDLIIVDLFCGFFPSPLLKNKNFISRIKHILKPGGVALINCEHARSEVDPEVYQIWNELFKDCVQLKYQGNTFLAVHISPIPSDYYSFFQDQFHATFLQKRGWNIIGEPRFYTNVLRLPFKLCIVHAINTDNEPNSDEIKKLGFRHGIIFWTQWGKRYISSPWKRCPTVLHVKGNGFCEVIPNYQEKWNKQTRWSLKKFKSFAIKIIPGDAELFLKGLQFSTLDKIKKKSIHSMIRGMSHASPLYLVAEKDGEIFGGLACVSYSNSIYYYAAYLTPNGRKVQTGTGLVDQLYQYAVRNKIKYINFGHIKQDGDPKSWQGFSDFKRNFIDQEIRLQNGYVRFF